MPATTTWWLPNWLVNFQDWLGDWFQKAWEFVRDCGLALWAFMVAVVGIVWVIISHVVPIVTLVLNTLNGIITGDWHFEAPSALSDCLIIANTFFPVETLFSLTISYMAITSALATYRLLKSWIPTDSGA